MSGEHNKADILVTTDWVADNLPKFNQENSGFRLFEVDVDTTSYDEGHIPGAVGLDWEEDLCDTTKRDLASKSKLKNLLENAGVDNDTTVLLYGDNNNWFATWAAWQLKYYGFEQVKLVDGGREKWLNEDRETTNKKPSFKTGDVKLKAPDNGIRAFSNYVKENLDRDDLELIDVRSPDEFTGKVLAPEGLNETAQRAGHIPGAKNIPWKTAINEDGTFKDKKQLQELYQNKGIDEDKEVIAYCRIGERSSHTWFVLNELLDFDRVRNYDGSWTEWGNLVGVPIEKGE